MKFKTFIIASIVSAFFNVVIAPLLGFDAFKKHFVVGILAGIGSGAAMALADKYRKRKYFQ